MLTRERMRELIDQHGLSDRADEIMADARPSIHLTLRYDVDEADIPIGASKMGGSPDVPVDFEFPKWNDQYLSFIAQIRLSDAKPYDLEDLLPETGMLYFFYENFQYIDHIHELYETASGPFRVIYLNDVAIPFKRMPHPVSEYPYFSEFQNKSDVAKTEVYEACAIEFEHEWTPLSEIHFGTERNPLPKFGSAEFERYWGNDGLWNSMTDALATPMHRLIGVETDIQFQYSMMEDASKAWNLGTGSDWVLLAQFDSDYSGHEKPGFQWADGGVIYFCIYRDDLRAHRFDRIFLYFTSV